MTISRKYYLFLIWQINQKCQLFSGTLGSVTDPYKIFVGSKVFTHARYWQIKKYVCMIFFLWGGGHLGGHVPPPTPPRSYAPANRLILAEI